MAVAATCVIITRCAPNGINQVPDISRTITKASLLVRCPDIRGLKLNVYTSAGKYNEYILIVCDIFICIVI